ncbi:MAG: hypothetical protein MJZ41_06940 [Bacteroidaceae bacterium]|nr:hypothetical protein [Bacteroidaceae bacterium]
MKKILSFLLFFFVAIIGFSQSPIKVADYRKSTLPNNGVYTVTGRTNGRIWGDGVYTDDSDLATVCVHAGILRAGETGIIQVTKKPGRSSYPSVSRNGVKSISYGAWDGSYSVALYNSNTSTSNTTTNKQSQSTTSQRNASVNAPQGPTNLKEYRKSTLPNNGVYTVTGRTNGRIWGDGVYTDDSDLATVCVHAGILRAGETGVIQVTKKPGRSSYPSVTRNGVKSISYGAWDGSYSVALYNSK